MKFDIEISEFLYGDEEFGNGIWIPFENISEDEMKILVNLAFKHDYHIILTKRKGDNNEPSF